MIDIESKVYTPIAQELRKQFPGISVSSVYVNTPPAFPHASIVEMDNYGIQYDTSPEERYAVLMYQIDVYSVSQSTKKAECKAILQVIDKMMYGMNFSRTSLTPVPNMENASIYRLTARYRAVSDGKNIFRN